MYIPDEFLIKSISKYRTKFSAEKYRDIERCSRMCKVRFTKVTIADCHCDKLSQMSAN